MSEKGAISSALDPENQKLAKQAQQHLQKGEFPQAYVLYLGLAKRLPEESEFRLRLGEACMALKRAPDALRIYRHLAAHLIQRGEVAQAISVSKRILEIDPKDVEIQKNLEVLYAQVVESPTDHWKAVQEQAQKRVREMAGASLSVPDTLELAGPQDRVTWSINEMIDPRQEDAVEFQDVRASGLDLADSASGLNRSHSGADGFLNVSFSQNSFTDLSLAAQEKPKAYPKIPLFSDLPPGAFAKVVDHFKRLFFGPNTVILKQGDRGDSIYILASGNVRVEREVKGQKKLMAQLKPGDFFGEFPYFAKAAREASVISETLVEVLELTRDSVDQITLENPKLERAMRTLYKARVLRNLLSESPLFSPLSETERENLLDLFAFRSVAPQEVVFEEGAPPDDFYVIQSGRVEILKKGVSEPLATLQAGDFFGEYAMITGSPRSATVRAVEKTELVLLTREGFRQLLQGRPQVVEEIKRIAKERISANLGRSG